MAVKIECQAEPLPGYRLIERVGGGGFGEVWKAEVPGGLFKAIKFVYGQIEGVDEDGARAEQELKALKRVKEVRHPYILSLERYDIIDGQLMIVMELADRTLWDRFKECRSEGLPGIPRKELLNYMRESAEALDVMNFQFGLQHLDVKPQNIFLVYDHVKVADFGLIKDLQGTVASVTGGVTPVYAAPETFDGKVSRNTDQYSLAIVYQELLTGHRPFAGTTARQLVLQHLQAEPDLSALPVADRPIVRKALDKSYDQRYPTCLEFVQALIAASPGTATTVSASTNTPLPHSTHASALPSLPHTKPPITEGRTELRDHNLDEATTPGETNQETADVEFISSEATPIGAQRKPSAPAVEAEQPATGLQSASKLSAGISQLPSASSEPLTEMKHHRAAPPKISSDGVFFPALVIGLGAYGQAILKQLRRQIQEKFGSLDPLPHIRFLYLDTDSEDVQNASKGGNHALRHEEVLHTRLHRASHYLKQRDFDKRIASWLPAKLVYSIPRQQETSGIRSLGRLAYVDSFATIRTRLQAEIEDCLDNAALEQASANTNLGIASASPRIYIVTHLAGGTGSGMFVDLAYLVRHLLKKYGLRDAEVVGLFLVPEGGSTPQQQAEQANACAALMELQHHGQENSRFTAFYSGNDSALKNGTFVEKGPPFQRCILLPSEQVGTTASVTVAPDQKKEIAATLVQSATLLFAELCTPLGRKADEFRQLWQKKNIGNNGSTLPLMYQCSGIYQIFCPRQQIIRQTARKICHSLVRRWMSKDARGMREGIAQWVEQQWADLRLSSDDLITRLQEYCEKELGQPSETFLAGLLNSMLPENSSADPSKGNGTAAPSAKLNVARVYQGLQQLEQFLGVPEDCQPLTDAAETDPEFSGKFIDILKHASRRVGNKNEIRIAELLVRLIEHPDFRLAGAEETIRQMSDMVHKTLHHQEALSKELQERSITQYERILKLLDEVDKLPEQSRSSWRFSFSRRTPSPHQQLSLELVELLRAYPKCRYQSLILKSVESLLVTLRGQLSDQLREVDFCRQRLHELAAHFDDDRPEENQEAAPKDYSWYKHMGKILLPDGCRSLNAVVKKNIEQVSAEDLLQLDHMIEKVIRKQFKALVHICLGSTSILRKLIPVMENTTFDFLNGLLQPADVVQLYMNPQVSNSPERSLEDKLLDIYEEAVPHGLNSLDGEELCILASPDSEYQQKLRDMVTQTIVRTNLEHVKSPDEIIIYRERLSLSPLEFKQLCKNIRNAYDQLSANEQFTPHSRFDISDWSPLGP